MGILGKNLTKDQKKRRKELLGRKLVTAPSVVTNTQNITKETIKADLKDEEKANELTEQDRHQVSAEEQEKVS